MLTKIEIWYTNSQVKNYILSLYPYHHYKYNKENIYDMIRYKHMIKSLNNVLKSFESRLLGDHYTTCVYNLKPIAIGSLLKLTKHIINRET